MRIIAGKNKAKRLNSPKTEKTRPTLDRVKEALFSIVDGYINNANVLDLFSGTGNLGLEAISRGAKFTWLNDDKNIAVSTIISNALLTNSQDYVKITKKDYMKCLAQIQKEDILFDIVLLDPPYDSNLGINTLKYISDSKSNILTKDGIIVYETDKSFISKISKTNEKIFEDFDSLKLIDKRTYGNVVLFMYKWR